MSDAASLPPVNRRAFLVATVGSMLQVRLIGAQAEVMQPVISEADCPLEVISPIADDSHRGLGVLRKPPGPGPFPAIIYLHGGITTIPIASLQSTAKDGANPSRFLAAGYVLDRPHLSKSRCRSAVVGFVKRWAGDDRIRTTAAIRRSREHRRVRMQRRWGFGA